MIKTRVLICFSLILIVRSLYAQIGLYSLEQLDTIRTYESMEEALINPEEVIKLVLKRKKLTTLPDGIEKLTNLQYLSLRKNKIDSLDSRIGNFSNLQVLILNENKIKALPDDIGKLSQLKRLQAGENFLTELTPDIGNLKNLEYLDVWSNDLADVPRTFEDLKNLKEADFRVNAIKQEDQDIIQELVPKAKIHFSYDCKCY